MLRRALTHAAVVLLAPLALAGAPPAQAFELLPLDQVRPGMVGVGRTVFQGTRIEEFRVTILGVLDNVGPRQSMILARLEGGPLAETGVIAGMSGSPVFIDGKLVGAVAYGFPFSKETIGGITPIAEMIEATRTETPRAASARFPSPFRARGGLPRPLDSETFLAALRRSLPGFPAETGRGALPPHLASASLQPLALPLVFSGFDASAFDWARGVFGPLGFAPVMGGGQAKAPAAPLPDLQPGSAVGVSLVEGDLDISVTGTVTHVDEAGRVYAFGHPFYNLGPTQFPMKKAYVYSIFPSLYQSWKISSAGEPVGTIDQDRTTAISGRLGATPRMIPVEVTLTTSRGQERQFRFRIVDDELFSPVLAYVSVLSILQTNERAFGTSTMQVEGRVRLASGREVAVEDLFAEDGPALRSAALVAAPLAYLMSNEFERVSIEKLSIRVTSQEKTQTAALERAWLERSGPVRAGATVPLKLLLRTFRGETVSESIPVTIPANAPAGAYTLLLADAGTLTAIEQREMRQAFVPRDLEQLMRAINGLHRSNRIYARLLRADDGAIVDGEYLQSLPGSVLSVLGTAGGGQVIPIRNAAVWDLELPTEYVFSGSRLLTLDVTR
jgi:hypothetical protein